MTTPKEPDADLEVLAARAEAELAKLVAIAELTDGELEELQRIGDALAGCTCTVAEGEIGGPCIQTRHIDPIGASGSWWVLSRKREPRRGMCSGVCAPARPGRD